MFDHLQLQPALPHGTWELNLASIIHQWSLLTTHASLVGQEGYTQSIKPAPNLYIVCSCHVLCTSAIHSEDPRESHAVGDVHQEGVTRQTDEQQRHANRRKQQQHRRRQHADQGETCTQQKYLYLGVYLT